jgi:predicted O-methyltransferase YrrM
MSEHDNNFLVDWFSVNIDNWTRWLSDFAGKPDISYLEVGCYEGRATLWAFENVLTHPTSQGIVIDTFEGSMEHHKIGREGLQIGSLYERFTGNLAPFLDRLTIRRGFSQDILREYRSDKDSFEIIYIDGSHKAADVLEDMVLSFRLLRHGGVMILDDYEWVKYQERHLNPAPGIDAFLSAFETQYELIDKLYQVCIRKL